MSLSAAGQLADSVRFVPVQYKDDEHIGLLEDQRRQVGWGDSVIKEWATQKKAGEDVKDWYWIVIDKSVNKQGKDDPEKLVEDASVASQKLQRVIGEDGEKFLPIGHIAYGVRNHEFIKYDMIKDDKKMRTKLGEDGKELQGPNSLVWLEQIFVANAFQGEGYGKAAEARFVRNMKEKKVSWLALLTRASNSVKNNDFVDYLHKKKGYNKPTPMVDSEGNTLRTFHLQDYYEKRGWKKLWRDDSVGVEDNKYVDLAYMAVKPELWGTPASSSESTASSVSLPQAPSIPKNRIKKPDHPRSTVARPLVRRFISHVPRSRFVYF